jgi:Sec-independent protein translocase protein TatA
VLQITLEAQLPIATVGPISLLVVLMFALIVLGPKKMMDLTRAVAQAGRYFQQAMSGQDEEQTRSDLEPSGNRSVRAQAQKYDANSRL